MKTRTKFVSGLLTMAILLTFLSACNVKTPDNQPSEPEHVATLVTDFSFARDEPDFISRYEYRYDGLLTVEIMAEGLSELTGLNFAINDSVVDDEKGLSVDWSPEATFIAGLGETPQKDEFFVYDIESLTWFMLNSMYRTIIENNDEDTVVFFSMDGGQPMMNELFAPHGFPVDMPYTGNHEGRGDVFDDINTDNLNDWLGTYQNADQTKTLKISHIAVNWEDITYFDFLLTTTSGEVFDDLAALGDNEEGSPAYYMDLTFVKGIESNDITIWQDEPYDDGHEREVFVDTYFRTD